MQLLQKENEMAKVNKSVSYEEAEARLEEIISLLNKPETSLEDSLNLVEEATALSSHCMKKLEEAKTKITELEKK